MLQVSSVGPRLSQRLIHYILGSWALISEYTCNLKERLEIERNILRLLSATTKRVQHVPSMKRVTYGPGAAAIDCFKEED